MKSPCDAGDRQHADEDRAFHLSDFKRDHDDEAEKREVCGGIADVAHADERVGVAHDQARVLEANKCDEETDSAGHRGVELVRNGAENHLADADSGEREKNDAREKHRSQRSLPGHVHLDAHRVGEIGVEAHAWRERNGIACDDAHQNGAKCG